MWHMRGDGPPRGNRRPSPTTNKGFPIPGFPPGRTSPSAFYAPDGPGPMMSAHGNGPVRMPRTSAPSMPSYGAYRPEHRPPDSRNRDHHHHKHRHRDPQIIENRQDPREAPRPFPHFVNQGASKPALVNPGFMNPDVMNSGSKHGHERRRTHSQSHSQGRGPGFNLSQGRPDPSFPDSHFRDRGSTQENIRHERGRTHSQGRSQGGGPGFNLSRQGSPNPGFPNSGFEDRGPTQEDILHERRRTHSQSHSQGRGPGFNLSQGSPNPGFANSGFGDRGPMQENILHERGRTHSQGRSQGHSPGFNPNQGNLNPGFGDPILTQQNNPLQRSRTHSQGPSQGRSPGFKDGQGIPTPAFPSPGLGNPILTHENGRHQRSRAYSQSQNPGFNTHQGMPNPVFPNPRLRDPNMNSHNRQENSRHERSHTYTQGHGPGYNQGHGRSHSHYRSESHDRRPRTYSSHKRPSITTASHVKPLPIPSPPLAQRQRQPIQQHMMPPPEPRRVRADSMSGGKDVVFQYSRCTGRKKALCIGINYRGQQNELRGCVSDAKKVSKFLITYWGYKPENVVLLTDDARDRKQIPTKKNMIEAMRWLVHGAKAHDALFFHYSGHGGQTKDLDGDEIDGLDEVIFPLDHASAGHIVDDDLHTILVKSLPQGCRLTGLFDSCHSGTALDLPYAYHSNGRLKGNQVAPSARIAKSTPADVISWCACSDDQTSADVTEHGESAGAMSYAFMLSLTQNSNQSYLQLLRSVREILSKIYNQKSQLSSSHPIDTNLRFII